MVGLGSACDEVDEADWELVYGVGSLRVDLLDEIDVALDSLPASWPSDVRDRDALKFEKALNVRDLDMLRRDFAFLSGETG